MSDKVSSRSFENGEVSPAPNSRENPALPSRAASGIGSAPSWRHVARPRIAAVLAQAEGLTEQQIRKRLRAAYPFGQRKHFPYKVWCDEIQRQRGLKPALGKSVNLEEYGQERLFG